MDKLITVLWLAVLLSILTILVIPGTRNSFVEITVNYPYVLGFIKFSILGIMGELLSFKIATGKWKLTGIGIFYRMLIWGFLGLVFTVVFPLFSYGVDGVINSGLLAGEGNRLLTAFWKSFIMNIIFAFPFMSFHRITDTLIDRKQLFSKWPLIEIYQNIDWENMFKIVGFAILWFWIPAHTITFMLPPEFRVITAALLAIVLGFILGFAKRMSVKQEKVSA